MPNMTLGTYTFLRDPKETETLNEVKSYAIQQTYSGVAYFSWGSTIAGKEVTLEWDYMEKEMFEALDHLYQADIAYVWDPLLGKTYNVEILSLTGMFFGKLNESDSYGRKDVAMELLILGEVEE